jgi:hypothetical protein
MHARSISISISILFMCVASIQFSLNAQIPNPTQVPAGIPAPTQKSNAQSPEDIGTALMRSVFKIEGPSSKVVGELSFGTAMIIGKPIDANRANYVLVTAAHVLNEIQGEVATITLRKLGDDGSFLPLKLQFRIRDGVVNRYFVHESQDVAAAYIVLPVNADVRLLSTSFLVTDDRIKKLELHPGDELYTLGFPLYLDINSFAVLRSGILASFPLTPMEKVEAFYFNFRVFQGNSGGPVFFDFANRNYLSRGTEIGREWGIVGLVSSEVTSSATGEETPLDVSKIVPALFIGQLIDRLPSVPMPRYTFTVQ